MNVKTTRILVKMITLSLITSTMVHATNGDNLIAVGTKARGMGGTSIAVSHGAESALGNPALIPSVESTEIGFGGTLFMPDIKSTFTGDFTHTSDADTNLIPEVSIAHKINDNWYIGIGIWGTAGMGVDYRNATESENNLGMVTNLQLMQFGVPIAYKTGGLSLAVTPVLQYGNLDINFNEDENIISAGLAQDFGFGYNLGLAYDFSANGVEGLTLGAVYKSSIEMNYDHQLSTAMKGFDVDDFSDALEQPSEYGVGIAYTTGQHTLAFDYKKIKWSDAKGYKTFGWEDSDVYAFGYQYTQDNWALRAGYNYSSSAVVETENLLFNKLNLLGFPATSERHYTLGGSYAFTKQFALDLAYVYSPKTTETFDISDVFPETVSTSHEENSVSFQLAYKF